MALLLCCAILPAGGCVWESMVSEPSVPPGPREMRFGVSSLETRGNAILSVEDITSLGVFGYTTDTTIPDTGAGGWAYPANLLLDQKVEKASADWVYDPVAYWPVDLASHNTFFAYSPHSSLFAPDSYAQALVPEGGGAPTLRYTLPEHVSDQKDVLYARPVYNINSQSAGVVNGRVMYQMEHALTWFALVLNPNDVIGATNETYSVERLTFKADNLPVASMLNLETGTWSTITHGNVDWGLVLEPSLANNIPPSRATRLTDDGNRIMLLPFDLTRGMAKLDVDYFYNPDGPSYDPETKSYIGNGYSYSLPVPATEMIAGKVVVYLINISPEGISVSFREEEWDDNWVEEWLSYGTTIGDGVDDEDWIQIF